MQSQIEPWRQFWIFQAKPTQYDAKTQLTVGQAIDWYVSRFIDRYREGDIVYLWIAGEDAGIYGWAEVEGEVFKDEAGKQRLKAVYRGVLAKPLGKAFLLAQPKVFDGMSILRSPTGTNFRVTVLEAIELNRLIADNGDESPPEPDSVPDPNNPEELFTKAVYVLDYRFDNDVKSVLTSCFASSRNINQTLFPSLLIQATLIHFANLLQQKAPPDFAVMLNDVLPLDKMREVLNFQEQIIDDSTLVLSPELADQIMVKRNVLALLAEARRIAIKTNGKEQIMARHLVGAILQGAVAAIQSYVTSKILEPFGLNLSEVREAYVNQIERRWPEDNIQNWRALISEELVTTTEEKETFSPLLTKIDSDSVDNANEDLLSIDDEAIAISKVLCAKDAAPPIAIGLFGEWGSGKTFFMRRIYRHVKSLTERVSADNNASPRDQNNKAYQSKVAQIWFNAWNYQDGKLWASLVNHVFVGLKKEMKRLNKDTADEQFKSLMKLLDEDRVIEEQLHASSTKLNALEKKKKNIQQRIEVLNSTNKAIEKKAPEERRRLKLIESLGGYSEEIQQVFGITGLQKGAADITNNVEQVKSIVNQVSRLGLFGRLKQWVKFFTRDLKATVLFLLSIGCIVSVSYFLMSYFSVELGSIGSVITVSLSLISTRLTKFGKFLDLADKIKNEFDAAPQSSVDTQQQIVQNEREIKSLQMQQLETQAEVEASQKEYSKLNASLGEPSDETFASFIFDRAESSDYNSQLGLLNMVRRDFSRLNELLTNQTDSSLPKIDRIVLYIDDLDRCEPEIVVDVLQAIHLMLAFPLFMVVVGVDARWLGRSLKKRYSFLVHEKEDRNAHELDIHAASTHDYLEKIFQIPFWLKRLDGERANDMIKALLKPDSEVRGESDVNVDPANQDNFGKGGDDIVIGFEGALFEETEDQKIDFTDERENDELLINNLISTRSLEMSEWELNFFQKLGAIVGRSPRAVKRFINLYRILKASHKKARMVGFSEENGGFKVPLFLLAVVCGSPKEAEDFFIQLKRAEGDDSLSTLIEGFVEVENCPGWNALVKALQASNDVIGELKVGDVKAWIADTARFSYREWVE
jgi:peptidoglycan hydrolase CwlO-like protein